jgi:hypothetical protein
MLEMDELDAKYFAALCLKRADARLVPFRTVEFRDGVRPSANTCHANVDRWVAENPGDAAMRGWLLQSHFGAMRIIAHSVVRSSGGSLFDLTPLGDERERPSLTFLEHVGNQDEFGRLARIHADQFFAV